MGKCMGWGASHLPPGIARAGSKGKMAGLVLFPLLLGCFPPLPGLEPTTAAAASKPFGRFDVASIGAPPGAIEPTRCVAGDHEIFLGADLVDPATRLVVRLVLDPLAGPAIRVYDTDAPFDRSVLFFREECTTFAMNLEPTGWIINDIIVRKLELEIDCENEDGAMIRGSASAARCD